MRAGFHWPRLFQEEYPIVDRLLSTEETRYDIPWYFIQFHTRMNYRVRLIYGKSPEYSMKMIYADKWDKMG